MGEIEQYLGIMLAIYAVRAFFGFANYWIVFEKMFDFPKRKWKNINGIWIIFYVICTLLYRPVCNYGPRILILIMVALYFFRIVPFLWSKYGWNPSFVIIVIFYTNVIEGIAQTIRFTFANNINIGGYLNLEADIAITIAEILACCVLLSLIILKRVNLVKIYFTKLTNMEYMILLLTNVSYGVLETAIFNSSMVNDAMRKLSIITFLCLMVLITHIIMVREENTSMNNMIGNLKEPMEQITASYIEMNEKNTELRRFRHDTKNLLLVLRSLIAEEKYEQAAEYIDKMQETMDSTKSKTFDTGNFIADALLESKVKTAAQSNITMTVEGCIPASKVEDVDLVILISNLLDNAIEATRQVKEDRRIEIQSILKKNIWILSVKNSCMNEVVIRENRIETTKDNKESHGFGLANIERVTKKYDGNLQLSCENKMFTAQTILMLIA
ncbi:MAG: GHKL domain-containing protein [Lachnospiraceae bacterium]|nr:GHKL domain-containing protein [Lachnospiraceae bacterium]